MLLASACCHLRLRRFQLTLRLLHRRVRGSHAGRSRLQGGTGVNSDDGYIHPHRFIVGLGTLQAGLVLLHRDLKVLGIDLGNQGTGLDILVLIHVDLDHLSGNPGADLYQVTIHLCVVGVFVIRGVPPEEQRAHDKNRDHADDDEPALSLFPWRTVQILLVVVASLGTLFDGTCTA